MSSATAPRPPALRPAAGRRESWRRHPPGTEFWVGVGILLAYAAIALSALVVFRSTLSTLVANPAWAEFTAIGPSWSTPFGVMPGFGINILTALWQAAPWDLAIVVAILAIDAGLGALIGAYAGLHASGWVDTALTFVGDSLGAIPSAFLVVVVFAGLSLTVPGGDSLPLFVLLFGLVLWPTTARTVRERARPLATAPYVDAARAAGAGRARLLFRHVLPSSLDPVLAQIPIDVVAIFFVLSLFPWFRAVTYISPPPPAVPPIYYVPMLPAFSPLPSAVFPEWGYLLGVGAFQAFTYPGGPVYWWMFLFPLLAIAGLGAGIAFACDGLAKWLRFGG